jgi:tetratricopeptide (TPR) repeat protein
LGRIAWTKKEFEKGERFLRAAIDKASRVYPDNPGLSEDGVKAHAWFDLGLAAAENGNLTDAWVRFLEALPHIYADKNYALAVACHENLGGIAERNGWVCAAIDHYQHELSACDELGDSSLTVQSLIRLAGLAYRLGDYCSTIRYLIRVTRESRDRSDRREAWSVMGDILEKLGEREFTRLWRAAVGENRLPEVLVRRVRKNRRFTSVARSRIADILSRIYGYIRNLLLRRGKNTAE